MGHYRNANLAMSAAVLLVCNVAFSQQRQPDPRALFNMRLGPPIIALESYTVRQDLKLTDEQADKLKRILDTVEEAQKKVGDGRDGDFAIQSAEEKKARRSEFRKKLDESNTEAVALLTDDQKVRIKQIQIWIRGGEALFTVDVCAELKITDEQKEAILEVFKDLKQKMFEIPMPVDGTPDEKRRKMMEQAAVMRNEFDVKYLAVLTKEQRAKFDTMRGPKIEVDMAEIPFISGRRP